MQEPTSCCLSNAHPWHEPVCPCWVLWPAGVEEVDDGGLTPLIQDQISPFVPKYMCAGSFWAWGQALTGLGMGL